MVCDISWFVIFCHLFVTYVVFVKSLFINVNSLSYLKDGFMLVSSAGCLFLLKIYHSVIYNCSGDNCNCLSCFAMQLPKL